MSFFQRFLPFCKKRATARRRPKINRLRGQLETLENRQLLASVLTYHNDLASTGVNDQETVLTRTNVNASTFGKVFSVSLDGEVYAQPIVKEKVNISVGPNAGVHNVVLVATQHGSIYAIDGSARSGSGQGVVLWKRNLLDVKLPGATSVGPVLKSDVGAGYAETSITGTPTIDPSTNTLFVIARSREVVNGTVHFVQRLHAIKLENGTARVAPALIGDTVNLGQEQYKNNSPIFVNGTGDGNDGHGRVYFNALRHHQRPALTLFKGVVYAAWASHEDRGPYHGWVVGWDAKTLALKAVFNDTPNGGLGGIWESGGGLSSDGTYLYFETGNGTFDGKNGDLVVPSDTGKVTGLDANGFPIKGNYGNSLLKVIPDATTSATHQNINGWGLKVVDYFTPFNQSFLDDRDLDLGSGAPVVLPDEVGSVAHPHLIVGAGKEGKMYLLDRDNMGKFGTRDNAVQVVEGQLSSSFDTAAYYQKKIYYVEGFGGTAKTFSINNGVMSDTPTSRSEDTFTYAGSTPSISANGTLNGIVWDVDRGTNQLRAYSSESYATELYHSGQAAGNRDFLGTAATFQVPTVANGHVYLGTASGTTSTLVAYGLIQPPTSAPATPSNLRATTISGTQVQLAWQANDKSPNLATAYVVQKSSDGGKTWTPVSSGVASAVTIGGLEKSTSYQFRVAATNVIGSSGYSNVLTVKTTAAASGFNFSAGFPATTDNVLALNATTINDGSLVLTNGQASQFRNVFSKVMQDITKFTTSFDLQISAGPSANGLAFVIQAASPSPIPVTVGAYVGEGLGYGASTEITYPHSAAIKFDLFRSLDPYEQSGDFISTTGLYLNGGMPLDPEVDLLPSGIDLHSGHTMTATIDYDFGAKQLTLTIADKVTSAHFTTVFYDVDLPAAIGGGAAYVGFTASTSKKDSLSPTQRILNWKFSSEGPPNPPTNLHTNLIGQTSGDLRPPPLSVELNWTGSDDATGYTIERKLGLAGTYAVLATVGGNVTEYTDSSLATQAIYAYRIKANNGAGESAFSSEVLATTPGRVPTPRFGTAAAVSGTSVTLHWNDFATNEAGFNIFRRSGASPYTLVASLPPNPGTGVVTLVDVGLSPHTDYDYHIQAFNLVGYSDFTGVHTETLNLPAAPEAFFEYLSSPRSTAANKVILKFSEAISGFTKGDLTLIRNGAVVPIAAAKILKIDNRTYSIDLRSITDDNGNYKLELQAAGSGIKDALGNLLSDDANLSWTKDSISPRVVSFRQVTPAPTVHLTDDSKIVFALRFSEPVSAISVRPTFSFSLSAQNVFVTTTDNVNFTITISELTGQGTLRLELNNDTNPIIDPAGNKLALANYPEPLSIVVDRTPPTVTTRTLRLEAGSADLITSAQLVAADGQAGLGSVIYKIVSLPEHLKLKRAGKLLHVGETFSQLDVNSDNLSFLHDGSAAATDRFTFTVSDGLNATVAKTLKFSIIPFNKAPTIASLPTQQTTSQTPVTFSGLRVTDPDAGVTRLRVTLTASFGNLTLASTSGLDFAGGTSNGAPQMTFTGTLANINQALDGMRFLPQPGYVGTALINIVVNDQGNAGTRIAKSIGRQIAVNVLSNDSQPTSLNLLGSYANDRMTVSVTSTSIDLVMGGSTYHYPRGKVNTLNVYGYGGDDTISINSTGGIVVNVFGGDGEDEITVAAAVTSRASLRGDEGNDILHGGSGGDILNGGGGNDRLVGGKGADRYIFGNAGGTPETDTIVELAGGGIDTLDFAAVNTAVTVDLRSDTSLVLQNGRKIVTGNSGQAAQLEGIVGGKGDDILRGNNANNYIVGNNGNDVLMGLGGNDTLRGGLGYDSLVGGNGNDAMLGGNGNDTYFFSSVAGTVAETDAITELADEGTDTLDFAAVTTTVTTNLKGNPLATHVRRTVNRGTAAELEEVRRAP